MYLFKDISMSLIFKSPYFKWPYFFTILPSDNCYGLTVSVKQKQFGVGNQIYDNHFLNIKIKIIRVYLMEANL